DGLRERLEGHQRGIEARVEAMGSEVVSGGLVDTPQAARQSGNALAAAVADPLMGYTATDAPPAQVLPVGPAARAPVVVLTARRRWSSSTCSRRARSTTSR